MITEGKPWDLVKDENQKQLVGAILYRAAETLRWLSVLLYPVMPTSTREIWKQLGETTPLETFAPSQLKWGGLQEGNSIGEVKPIFPRLDKTKIMSEITNGSAREAAHATTADAVPGAEPKTSTPAPAQHATEADAVGVTDFIEIGDFAKVDLRVGQVVSAERIPKADKLLLLKIDIGEEQPRQVLAGIAQYYEPENLLNRKVVVVANLKPRKLRGFESQGMVVAASYGEEGRPVIATFTEDVPNGARLK
jgi:methionyl-tRNA synthetase